MFSAVANMVTHAVDFIDKSNKIYIRLNQPSYVGGDIISGTVEMDCTVPFFAKGVLLRVKGYFNNYYFLFLLFPLLFFYLLSFSFSFL